ncbi:MAG TPA: hypothetical protein VFK02_33275 [Kofleriaceae bacterium]|nr:hypothetical protein [Kofleriaceae bacterium]
MNESWLPILSIIALVFGVSAILFDVVVYRLHRRALRRHYSRFPMFAIRDELVRLVVSGELSEESTAWQSIYRSVNSLLVMHQRLDVVDVMWNLAMYHLALRQDPALREESERIDRERDAEAERVPAFNAVLDKIDSAFFALVLERSWPLPGFRLKLAPWRLKLLFFARLFFRRGARRLTREISQQGGRQLPGWQQWRTHEAM